MINVLKIDGHPAVITISGNKKTHFQADFHSVYTTGKLSKFPQIYPKMFT
ncbi:hypothetical protein C4N58_004321 [Salmonella enterica subsp. enterica serovar Sandiego]|nr:hypothetical protein [Salmonella enterica subsp. enterica serovar Sandiego]